MYDREIFFGSRDIMRNITSSTNREFVREFYEYIRNIFDDVETIEDMDRAMTKFFKKDVQLESQEK